MPDLAVFKDGLETLQNCIIIELMLVTDSLSADAKIIQSSAKANAGIIGPFLDAFKGLIFFVGAIVSRLLRRTSRHIINR